jgi:hypothetical protein
LNNHFSPELQALLAINAPPLPHQDCAAPIVAELLLNSREYLRAEIITRNGRPVVRLERWKLTRSGPCRTGKYFEFAAYRAADIARMTSEVQRHLELHGSPAR